ncbi:hypothetical protein [Pseudescherichia sp.]|uniref:hypothetical protein n=1 Tax=Pseudescherichia sp. TaxID=2055881 RepID=UPI002897F86A|nr:hypothetical protein [Pseudescherichia sp.]
MKSFLEFINLAWRYILITGVMIVFLVVLKSFNVTTLGTFGIIALILTVIPGFSITRKYFKPIAFKGKNIDLLFLSGVAVAIVALPFSIFDDQANIYDRWAYGIVGGSLIILIIISVVKNR